MARDRLADHRKDFLERLKTDDGAIQACKEKIIAGVAAGLSESGAAIKEGVKPAMLESWKKEDPAFAQYLLEAFGHGTDKLADKAYKRAAKSSDRLIEFLLERRDPAKYGKDGDGTFTSKPLSQMTIAEIEAKIKEARQIEAAESRMIDVTPTARETVQE